MKWGLDMAQLDDFNDYPTVMRFYQELDVIRTLQKMPLNYLRDNAEAFKDLIDALSYSHGENIGSIRPDNEKEFIHFGDWLDHTWKELDLEGGDEVSDIFRITMDDVANEYPGWRKEAKQRDMENRMLMNVLHDLCNTHQILSEVTRSDIYKRSNEVTADYLIAEIIVQLADHVSDKKVEVQTICDKLGSAVVGLQTSVAELTRNSISAALDMSGDDGLVLKKLLPSELIRAKQTPTQP